MDLRAYYIQAAEAAAAAVHADDDDDDDVTELTPKALLLKLEVQAAGTADDDAPASRKGSGSSPLGIGNVEAGMVVAEGSVGRDLTCPECGKAFLSGRAMYGHLRSHPERGYKGATRPATAGAAAVDGDRRPRKVPRKGKADGPWSKWPVTAKRGRASCASVHAAAPPSSSSWCSEEEEEAAMILLEMAAGSRGGTASEARHPRRPIARTTRDAGHQMPDVEQPMLLDDDDDRVAQNQTPTPELLQLMPSDHVACAVAAHQLVTVEDDPQHIVRLELSPQVIVEPQTTPEVNELLEIPTEAVLVVVHGKSSTPANQQQAAVAKKQKKRRVLPDPERTPPPGTTASPEAAGDAKQRVVRRIPSPASDKKHDCTTCRKSFPTHQALGGHMSSHAKDAKHAARRDDDHPAVMVQAMRNILAHRKQKGGSNAVVGADAGAAAEGGGVAGASKEATVLDGAGQEGAVVGAVLDHHFVEPPAPAPQSPTEHVCPDCNKTFPSGQALGGHKRKHWYPEKKQAKAVLAAASQNFDLNELPSEGDEENQP